MRNKTALPKTVDKYINFLLAVRLNSAAIDPLHIEEIVKLFCINKSVVKPLSKLNIINRTAKDAYTWIERYPDKQMALQLLDYVLHTKKRQEPVLLPEWATMLDVLKEIRDSLKVTQPIEITALDSVKTSQSDRIYLAGQIANRIYESEDIIEIDKNMSMIKNINRAILLATDDLLNQLNSAK